jgi:iron complex outermembrane receptor protein
LKLQPLLPSLLFTGAVAVLVTTPANADVVKVTGVRLNPTANGLEVILETASRASPQVNTSSDNQTLLIDLSNAQLNLPESREFRSENPVEGITSVTVTSLSANSIRVRVTGSQVLPKAQVIPSPQGLVLSLSAASVTAETTPTPETPQTRPSTPNTPGATPEVPTEVPQVEEEIEIVVTGEQEQERGYRVPSRHRQQGQTPQLRDIPQSIQVVPQQVLEDQQVQRVEDALENVSGVQQTVSSLNVMTVGHCSIA